MEYLALVLVILLLIAFAASFTKVGRVPFDLMLTLTIILLLLGVAL